MRKRFHNPVSTLRLQTTTVHHVLWRGHQHKRFPTPTPAPPPPRPPLLPAVPCCTLLYPAVPCCTLLPRLALDQPPTQRRSPTCLYSGRIREAGVGTGSREAGGSVGKTRQLPTIRLSPEYPASRRRDFRTDFCHVP